MAAGHGGQILMSVATEELVRGALPADLALRDLGERRLKDLIRPERIYQVIAPDLPGDFPPLKALDARPNNLPAQTTPFIGREYTIRAVKGRSPRRSTYAKPRTGHCKYKSRTTFVRNRSSSCWISLSK
jgi:hypothetical protein